MEHDCIFYMIFTARPKPTRKTTAVVINIPENSVKII
jgi:hypothetical protein